MSVRVCVCVCVCVRGMKMLLQKKNSNDLNRASAVFTLCSLSLEVVTSLFSMSFAALYIFDDSGLPQNRVTTRKITSVRVSPHCTGCTALHPLSRKVSMYDIHKSRPPWPPAQARRWRLNFSCHLQQSHSPRKVRTPQECVWGGGARKEFSASLTSQTNFP